jgi:hypothetical protein
VQVIIALKIKNPERRLIEIIYMAILKFYCFFL